MTAVELYCKGTEVWVSCPDSVWRLAEISEDYTGGDHLRLSVEGEQIVVKIGSEKDLPPLNNPDFLQGVNDLTQLSYLHEPAVLHNLKTRFTEKNAIYTYCGIVLVAINPYQELSIYDPETMEAYRGCAIGELDPHIFAIAEEAYSKMEREDRDQSIIVSGESGAGKTVSAKYAMRYFASVKDSGGGETNVEKRVLATNPIMEAFGNAKTTRNDNSSRFGKFIEIDFDKSFSITGAKMRTYLLEKSRVVFQSDDERNYHIFYQLCSMAKSGSGFAELQLGSAADHRYTNRGNCLSIDGVDDSRCFLDTISAMCTLSFSEEDQSVILRILAAILHLGDVKLTAIDQDSCMIVSNDTHLSIFAKLLGIDSAQMSQWMTKKKLVTGREAMAVPLRLQDAETGRDAFSKHLYARLFNWIVSHINRKLCPESSPYHFIGVLDIYGFEVFAKNSFEQFCINYANEKLQQQFVHHVFKLEQEQYIKEEIEWTMIDYCDNQPCIDLIESRLGILDLLDEECKVPKGSDQSWCRKLFDAAKQRSSEKPWGHFEKPRFSQESFIVIHFADRVEYDCDGFLDKNRDTMNEEFVNLLRASTYPLVAQLFHESSDKLTGGKSDIDLKKVVLPASKNTPTKPGTSHKTHAQSVSSQFQESLKALMTTLNATTPHYVRCIKPNDCKTSFAFENLRATQQLRACGVLETIRINAAGFPTRLTYKEFFHRYRVMCNSKEINRSNIRETVQIIVRRLVLPDKYKFGRSMIFFRAGQVAYMEKKRSDRRMECATLIQKTYRGWKCRRRFMQIRKAVIMAQSLARGHLARKRFIHTKQTAAATKIQAAVRGFLQRKRYEKIRKCVIGIQALARGQAARKAYNAKLREKSAVVIQRHVRGFLARRAYKKNLRRIVIVQSAVRRHLAKKQLKALKIEARNVDHIKKLNKGLENKIISLQQRLDEISAELEKKKRVEEEAIHLREKLVIMHTLEDEMKRKTGALAGLERTIEELRKTLLDKEGNIESLNSEVGRLSAALKEKDTIVNSVQEQAKLELAGLKQQLADVQEGTSRQSEVLKTEYEEKLARTQKETVSERELNERLRDELGRLRQRHSNLEDFTRMRESNGHRRSPSSVSTDSNLSIEAPSTAYVQDPAADDGYSTQRSRPPNQSPFGNASLNGDYEKFSDIMSKSVSLPEHELESLRTENAQLKHILDLRPELDHTISDTLLREQERNWNFTRFIRKAQDLLVLPLEDEQRLELLDEASECLKETVVPRTSKIANVGAEDISSLDPKSLNDLFLSLREALAIQAVELGSLADQKDRLNEKCKVLIRENECIKIVLSRMTGDAADINGLKNIIVQTGAQIKQIESARNATEEPKRRTKKHDRSYTAKGVPHHAELGNESSELLFSDVPPDLRITRERTGGFLHVPGAKIQSFVRTLLEIDPSVAARMEPGFPAYLLFMVVRNIDEYKDEKAVRELFRIYRKELESVLKDHDHDIPRFALWLLNNTRLADLLRQYGDQENAQFVKPKQRTFCLNNFDLTAFAKVLTDASKAAYKQLLVLMQKELKEDAAKAIIEREIALGLSHGPTGGTLRQWRTKKPADCHQSLYQTLTYFYDLVTTEQCLDRVIVAQIFRQLFYHISMLSVNFLLSSHKHCTVDYGIQIRANVSDLQEWVRARAAFLPYEEVMSGMAAINECATLLLAKKYEEKDIEDYVACAKVLSNAQILKLTQNYQSMDEYDKVRKNVLEKLKALLAQRVDPPSPGISPKNHNLNAEFFYEMEVPFTPSEVDLESIREIPEVFKLKYAQLM